MNKKSLWFLSLLILSFATAQAQDALPNDSTSHAPNPAPPTPTQPVPTPESTPVPSNLQPPPDISTAPVSGEAPTASDKPSGTPSAETSPDPNEPASPSPTDPTVGASDPATSIPADAPTTPATVKTTDPVKTATDLTVPPRAADKSKFNPNEVGPPAPREVPIYLKRVVELLQQHDESMAISYLRQIVPNGILSDGDRSQALIELADCLTETHQQGEALTWLRLWIGLFPGRPEAGAVDFRIGCLYEYMRMPREARDTFYLALSATINHGEIADTKDLNQYSCLTTDILWKMAENEYACGQYARSAQLFERYRKEASAASPLSKEQAEFLEADAAYQSHDLGTATGLYETCIAAHPFNPLVLEARLRLYHLYMLENQTAKAEQDMKSLAWTVRTVWPQDETYWQKRALELLLEVNKGNPQLQVPILAAAQRMHVSSDLQDELDHYTQLNALQSRDISALLQRSTSKRAELNAVRDEETKVDTLSQSIDRLVPAE